MDLRLFYLRSLTFMNCAPAFFGCSKTFPSLRTICILSVTQSSESLDLFTLKKSRCALSSTDVNGHNSSEFYMGVLIYI